MSENFGKLKGWLIRKHFKNRIEAPEYCFSIFDSIESSAEIWDGINKDKDIFLSTDYLRALEKAPPENMKFKYAILYDDNRPTAIVYFQMLTLDERVHRPLVDEQQGINNIFRNRLHLKMKKNISSGMLVCGNALLSGEHGFACVPGTDPAKLLKGITELIERVRRMEKMHKRVNIVMIKDFYSKADSKKTVLSKEGYYDYFAGPNMAVPIRENWRSFNDYLTDMKPKYRGKVSSAIKKGGRLIRKQLDYDEIVSNKDILYKLYLQVANKAKFRLFALNPEMPQELKRLLKEKFILEAYYIDEKIVAYTTRIFNGDVLEGYSHGLEYSLNKEYDIYQNILLDDIKEGINRRVKKINFGRTSIAMKSSFGAIEEDMEFLMQFRIIIPNQFIRRLSKHFKPQEEHCRNPFA